MMQTKMLHCHCVKKPLIIALRRQTFKVPFVGEMRPHGYRTDGPSDDGFVLVLAKKGRNAKNEKALTYDAAAGDRRCLINLMKFRESLSRNNTVNSDAV